MIDKEIVNFIDFVVQISVWPCLAERFLVVRIVDYHASLLQCFLSLVSNLPTQYMRTMRPTSIRTYCSNTSFGDFDINAKCDKQKTIFGFKKKKIFFGAMKMGRVFGVAFRLYFVSSLCSCLCVVYISGLLIYYACALSSRHYQTVNICTQIKFVEIKRECHFLERNISV